MSGEKQGCASGCLQIAIICAIVSIIMAVAMPAYQQYTAKSTASAPSTSQPSTPVVTTEKVNVGEGLIAIKKPSVACSLLSNQGLKTKKWKVPEGGDSNEYGCNSPYKEIGTGFPLANNLAYYVEGVRNSVTTVKLMLNVNNKDEEDTAKNELLKDTERLAHKITNQNLPASINTAILNGENASTKLSKTVIEVVRSDWPTGRGYDLEVSFK